MATGSSFEQLRSRFAAESRDRLSRMRSLIRTVDSNPADLLALKELLAEFHRIGGSAAIFKFERVSEAAKKAELACKSHVSLFTQPSPDELSSWRETVSEIMKELGVDGPQLPVDGKPRDRILVLSPKNEKPGFAEGDSKTAFAEIVHEADELRTKIRIGRILGLIVDVSIPEKCVPLWEILTQLHGEGLLDGLAMTAVSDKLSVLDRMRLAQVGVVDVLPVNSEMKHVEGALRRIAGEDAGREKINIFVLARDEKLRNLIKSDLSGEERIVHGFDSPPDVVQKWMKTPPDMLIIDGDEKDYYAADLCKKLRHYDQFSRVHIIFLFLMREWSGEARDRVFRYGVDDYLIMPYSTVEAAARLGPRIEVIRLSQAARTPFEQAKREARAAAPAGLECAPGSEGVQLVDGKVRVLIADDDPFVRDILDYHIKKEGWELETAADGAEAEGLLKSSRFSFLMLDVMMPFQTGFDVLKWLATTDLKKSMKVVMLTAHDQDSTVMRAFSLGADDFIPKPFNPEVVVSRLKRFLVKE
jgi:two-component system response regulator VicR